MAIAVQVSSRAALSAMLIPWSARYSREPVGATPVKEWRDFVRRMFLEVTHDQVNPVILAEIGSRGAPSAGRLQPLSGACSLLAAIWNSLVFHTGCRAGNFRRRTDEM